MPQTFEFCQDSVRGVLATEDTDGVAALCNRHYQQSEAKNRAGTENIRSHLVLRFNNIRYEGRPCILSSIYHGPTCSQITEEFTYLNNNNNVCVFTDLEEKEQSNDYYLVLKLFGFSRNSYGEECRHGIAVGVIDINNILNNISINSNKDNRDQMNDEKEKMINVKLFKGNDFTRISSQLFARNETDLNHFMNASVLVTLLRGNFDPQFPLLQNALFCSPIRKGEIILYEPKRNDVYFTLKEGNFKTSKADYSIGIQIRDNATRKAIPNCLFLGSQCFLEEGLSFQLTSDKTTFNETYRITLTENQMRNAHIFFTVKVAGNKVPLCFGFLKLINDNTLIPNREFVIDFFRTINSNVNTAYLTSNLTEGKKGETLSISVVSFSTIPLCNTTTRILTDPNSLVSECQNISAIDIDEKALFAVELSDALLRTLDQINPTLEFCNAIFSSLVRLISELTDLKQGKRYTNLKERFEQYIDTKMNYMNIHEHILGILERITLPNFSQKVPLMQVFKSLPHLYRILFISRMHFLHANNYPPDLSTDVDFKARVLVAAQNNVAIMSPQFQFSTNARGLLIRNFDQVIKYLAKFLSPEDISPLIWNALDLFGDDERKIKDKRLFINRLLDDSSVVFNADLVQHLLPMYIHSGPMLAPIAANVCDFGFLCKNSPEMKPFIENVIAPLLPVLLDHLMTICSPNYDAPTELGKDYDHTISMLGSSFLALISTLIHIGYLNDAVQSASPNEQQTLLFRIFSVFLSLSENPPFRSEWFFLDMFWKQVIAQTVYVLAPILQTRSRFLNAHGGNAALYSKECELWRCFFEFVLLTISRFNEINFDLFQQQIQQDITVLRERYVDLPQLLLPWASENWKALEDKTHFVALIKTVLLMLKHNNQDVHTFVECAYLQLVYADFSAHNNIEQSKVFTFEPIDSLLRTKQAKPEFIQWFFTERILPKLKELQGTVADELGKSVSEIIGRLTAFVSLPDSDTFQDERSFESVRLLGYYKSVNQNTFFNIVHSLYSEHISMRNYLEAGLGLLLHANELSFNAHLKLPSFSAGSITLPSQSSMERKETLYNMAIDCFERARTYEKAIKLIKELVQAYAKDKKHFRKIITLLTKESDFFNRIADGLGMTKPNYFYVMFQGNGFPYAIQGKEFIFRHKNDESETSLIQRLTRKASNVCIVSSADEMTRGNNVNYVIYHKVFPVLPNEKNVNPNFNSDNNICEFYDSEERVEKKTYYTTTDSFPFILKHSEISSKKIVTFSPGQLLQTELDIADSTLKNLKSFQDTCKGANSVSAIVPLQLVVLETLKYYLSTNGLMGIKTKLLARNKLSQQQASILVSKLNEVCSCIKDSLRIMQTASSDPISKQLDEMQHRVYELTSPNGTDNLPPSLASNHSSGRLHRTMTVMNTRSTTPSSSVAKPPLHNQSGGNLRSSMNTSSTRARNASGTLPPNHFAPSASAPLSPNQAQTFNPQHAHSQLNPQYNQPRNTQQYPPPPQQFNQPVPETYSSQGYSHPPPPF